MLRKTLTILLAALLLLSILPLSAAANTVKSGVCGVKDAETDPDGAAVTWTLDNKGVLTISGKGDMDEYGLRSEGELPTEEEVRSIVVEEGVTAIHGFQFYTAAESVTLPKTITEIPESTFFGFRNLPEIDLPETLTSIGRSAFSGCTALKKIEIPNSVTNFSTEVFENCTALEEVTLSDGITELPYATFRGCTALETIHWPKNLTVIGPCAFEECTGLQTIEIPSTVTVIDDNAFYKCKNLKTIKLHEGLTEIKENAFRDCMSLQTVEIPASVQTIEIGAFAYCYDLSRVTILSADTVIYTSHMEDLDVFHKNMYDRPQPCKIAIVAQKGSEAEKYVARMLEKYPDNQYLYYQPYGIIPGDVNGDGEVTAEDARYALRAAVGLDDTADGLDFSDPQNRCYIAADVDGEAGISAADARLILRAAVGLETLA